MCMMMIVASFGEHRGSHADQRVLEYSSPWFDGSPLGGWTRCRRLARLTPLTRLFSGSHSHLGTDLLQAALAAARLPRQAGSAAVMDQAMAKVNPLRPWN